MAIAMTLQRYLDDHDVSYDVITHRKTGSSSRSAQSSHISGNNLAKGVVLKSDGKYLLAVLPATGQVELERMRDFVAGSVSLATESEASRLFPDCEEGAMPALGLAYGLTAVVDDDLHGCEDIYFEGGDHRSLVHISGAQFDRLMSDVPHGRLHR
ncbi:MAG: YbaK/EbsC family protein [Hyphomicrobiales bacterium]|nr:YbaK/EbsC family protein [Hyphomicrobiales bacterium]